MHRSKPSIRSPVGGGEERWRNGDVESPRSLEVDHLVELDRHLDRQVTSSSRSAASQAIQAVTQLGPHTDYGGPNTVEHNSGLSRDLSSRTVRLPSRCRCGPASKIYELQLLDPTFANEFVRPRAVFFQGLGAGDGNRTHDIQLGKLTYVIDFIRTRSSSLR